jgi:putative MATE family efflux protein
MTSHVNPALEGNPVKGYLSFAIPSVIALLAMSAAPIIDGLFIANYLGVEALASVNLVIPFFTIAFGFSYMIGIGGSVSAGKFIGEDNKTEASNIFSKTMIIGILYSLIISIGGWLISEKLFAFLGAGPELFPLMHDYFNTLILFFPAQIIGVVLYYYVRISGFPTLISIAIVVGVLINIGLNYLFIGVLEYGLRGAAFATGLSAISMVLIMLLYRFSKKAWLTFSLSQTNWKPMFHYIYNGLSDLVDEISAGVLTFVLNLVVISTMGASGVAAFSVVSYSLYIGYLFFFGLSESMQAVCSQCYGALNEVRMKQFLKITLFIMVVSAVVFSSLLLTFGEVFIGFFLDGNETELIETAKGFIAILWPIFIFNGINIIVSAYLTTIHHATASATLAIMRALVLPLGFLYILLEYFTDVPFLLAITGGEMVASLLAIYLYFKFRPEKVFAKARARKKEI